MKRKGTGTGKAGLGQKSTSTLSSKKSFVSYSTQFSNHTQQQPRQSTMTSATRTNGYGTGNHRYSLQMQQLTNITQTSHNTGKFTSPKTSINSKLRSQNSRVDGVGSVMGSIGHSESNISQASMSKLTSIKRQQTGTVKKSSKMGGNSKMETSPLFSQTQALANNFNSSTQQRMSINKPNYTNSSLHSSSVYSTATKPTRAPVAGSSFMNRVNKQTDMGKFWEGLSKIAAKNQKINQRTGDRDKDSTIIGTTRSVSRHSNQPASAIRGQGMLNKGMNGVEQRRTRRGNSEVPEHNLTGSAMCQIMRPEEETKDLAQPRYESQTRRVPDRFVRSSQSVGATARMSSQQPRQAPQDLLRPDRNFRRANEASLDRLWVKENEFDMYEEKKLSRNQVEKSRSRERYFQSSISTLPGPRSGLNAIKDRDLDQQQKYDQEQAVARKGVGLNQAYSSHISSLPGASLAKENTDSEIEERKQARDTKKFKDPAFQMKSNFYGSSFYQDDKHRDQRQSEGGMPQQYSSYNRGLSEPFYNLKKSENAKQGHSKIFQSSFKLE